MFEALANGTIGEYYDAQVVSDAEVEDGVASGRLVVDTRLRDALRRIADGRDAARVRDADARGRGDVCRRGSRSRRGGCRSAPTAPRRARAPTRLGGAGTPEPDLPEARRPGEARAPARLTDGLDVSRPTMFVVLTTQRSGSSWLVDLLDDHPAVTAYAEMFRVTDTTVRTTERRTCPASRPW